MPRRTKYWQCLVLALLMITTAPTHAELVVYTAQVIRTMEPALPTATAVAVGSAGSMVRMT